MEYFNERFKQFKNSDLPAIPGANGNVGLKCFTQPFNNFLDPGGFNFYPNFNYSRFFENDMRSCRHSNNYLPAPPVHGTANIKQPGPPFCYSGMASSFYQNCYQNGDPKAHPHHANFFYPPNFYPQGSPYQSRVTPPSAEFGETSKQGQGSDTSSAARRSHQNIEAANQVSRSGVSAATASTAVAAATTTSRNCSYIPHRPFQNSETFIQNCLWNSLSTAGNFSKHQDKIMEGSAGKTDSDGKSTNQEGSNNQAGDGFYDGAAPSRAGTSQGEAQMGSGNHHHHHRHQNKTAQTSSKKSGVQTEGSQVAVEKKLAVTGREIRTAEADSQSNASKVSGANPTLDGCNFSNDMPKKEVPAPLSAAAASSSSPPQPSLPLEKNRRMISQQQEAKFDLIKCPLCGEHLTSNDNLDLHLRTHMDSLPPADLGLLAGSQVKGQEGNKKKSSKKKKNLKNSQDGIVGGGEGGECAETKNKPLYQCISCPKSFTRVDKLKLHVSKRHPELLSSFYKCPHCQQGFEKSLALKRHLKAAHPGLFPKARIKPQYSCDECGSLLTSKRELVYHLMSHAGESPLQCSECGGRFTRPDKLRRHMFIHTGELPFTCSRCGQGFSRTDRLKEHTRLVHNETLLKCPSCDRVFDTWLQVKHHLKSHEYTCTECGESFTRKRRLQFHLLAHKNDKLLRCSECGIRFNHPSRLKKHVEAVHSGKPIQARLPPIEEGTGELGNQMATDELSKVKVEIGDPSWQQQQLCEDQLDEKMESWSFRLRRMEVKPFAAGGIFAENMETTGINDGCCYEDIGITNDIGSDDDDEDGIFVYDSKRGSSIKRKKKKKKKKKGGQKQKNQNKKLRMGPGGYSIVGNVEKVEEGLKIKIDNGDDINYAAALSHSAAVAAANLPAAVSYGGYGTGATASFQDSSCMNGTDAGGSGSYNNHSNYDNSYIDHNNYNDSSGYCDHDANRSGDETDVETGYSSKAATFYCTICYAGFSNAEELSGHSKEHLPVPGYGCHINTEDARMANGSNDDDDDDDDDEDNDHEDLNANKHAIDVSVSVVNADCDNAANFSATTAADVTNKMTE